MVHADKYFIGNGNPKYMTAEHPAVLNRRTFFRLCSIMAAGIAAGWHRKRPCQTPGDESMRILIEKAVLCCLLLEPAELMPTTSRKISPGDFVVPAHAVIYRTLLDMDRAGTPIDIISLTQSLRDKQQLQAAGGPELITEIFLHLPSAANYQYYVEALRARNGKA